MGHELDPIIAKLEEALRMLQGLAGVTTPPEGPDALEGAPEAPLERIALRYRITHQYDPLACSGVWSYGPWRISAAFDDPDPREYHFRRYGSREVRSLTCAFDDVLRRIHEIEDRGTHT